MNSSGSFNVSFPFFLDNVALICLYGAFILVLGFLNLLNYENIILQEDLLFKDLEIIIG